MRSLLAAIAALAAAVACTWWGLWIVAILSTNLRSGQHESALPVLLAMLAVYVWGLASAVGVLARREWARKSFVAWAMVMGLMLWAPQRNFGAPFWMLVGLLLAAWVVAGARHSPRANR